MPNSNVISRPISGSSQALETSEVTYYGFTFRETAGATAVVRIRSGGVITGDILETVSLAASESTSDLLAPQGLRCPGGLYVEIVSGTVEGAVRLG